MFGRGLIEVLNIMFGGGGLRHLNINYVLQGVKVCGIGVEAFGDHFINYLTVQI